METAASKEISDLILPACDLQHGVPSHRMLAKADIAPEPYRCCHARDCAYKIIVQNVAYCQYRK